MNQYLAEILGEIKTLIIPDFGALTVTNEETNELMFMPYLKYDDGKLVAFLVAKKNISEEQAKEEIKKFVSEIEIKLNNGQNFELKPFGSFSKDSSGDVEFIKNEDVIQEEKAIFSDKFEEISEEEIVAETEEIVVEQTFTEEPSIIPIVEDEPIVIEEIQIVEKIVEVPETVVEETTHEIITPIVENPVIVSEEDLKEDVIVSVVKEEETIIPEDKTESEVYTEEHQWKDDLDLPPLNVVVAPKKKPILEKAQKDKKRKRPAFYILLILSTLILAFVLTMAMFYSSFEKIFPFLGNKHSVEEVTPPSKKEEISNQATKNKPQKEEKVEEIIEKPIETKIEKVEPMESSMIQTSTGKVDRNKPFHIIGGAFSERSNADNYQSTLISGGNSSTIIGQFDNLYIVSIASYSTKEEAQNALKASKDISTNAWIFKWP